MDNLCGWQTVLKQRHGMATSPHSGEQRVKRRPRGESISGTPHLRTSMTYQLQCLKTGDLINDDYTLHYTDNALLRAVYDRPFKRSDAPGVWQYLSWLPVSKANDYVAGTVTYKADELGHAMGLSNLWVTFHGYWPEKGGLCPTGSFKDMEAVPTIQRLRDHSAKGLICASAGNTARAFSHFCGLDNIPLIVVVGKDHADRLWALPENSAESVRLVVVEDGDYYDAKTVAKGIAAQLPGWQMEGSVHNVARRDGNGSLMIDAAMAIGHTSLTITSRASVEAPGRSGSMKWRSSSDRGGSLRRPSTAPAPFTKCRTPPDTQGMAGGSKRPLGSESDYPPEDVEVYSDYLMNKGPAYGQTGAVHDILKDSKGQTYIVEREDAMAARELIESTEEYRHHDARRRRSSEPPTGLGNG